MKGVTVDERRPLAIDVFSGIGGMSEGLSAAGFDVRLAIDSDVYSYLAYVRNRPSTPVLWQDVRKIRSLESPLRAMGLRKSQISLLAGGPPCQGFSFANRRTNHAGNLHNAMIARFLRLVKEVRPPAVVLENVEGLAAFAGGGVLQQILDRLERLGYVAEARVLNAADNGVPQLRRRLFVVGIRGGGFHWPRKTHGPDAPKSWITVADAILGDLPPLNGSAGERQTGYLGPPRSRYQRVLRRHCSALYDHVTTTSGTHVKRRFALVPPGSGLFYLQREKKVPDELKIHIGQRGVYRRLDPEAPSLTIGNVGRSLIIHPVENRIISLREAARLQSFRDTYRFPGGIGKMQQAIGNAVPPLLARAVGLRVRKVLAQ